MDRHCGIEKREVSFLEPQTGKMKWGSQEKAAGVFKKVYLYPVVGSFLSLILK